MKMKRNLPVKPKRVVVKVGTGILTLKNYRLNKFWIKGLVTQITALSNKGMEVILVTSGAIGAGMGMLGLKSRPKGLPGLQASAAIGQSQLMQIYDTFFKQRRQRCAQVLLTREDLSNRKRYLNAKNTLFTLLAYKVVPIINENDTVSVDEIKFGDNDRLSALVAGLLHAEMLIILSDVHGLYAWQPKKGKKPSKRNVVSTVEDINPEIERTARASTGSKASTGGMASKVEAAKICCTAGITCIIAHGKVPDVLLKITSGQNIGTLFCPKKEQLAAKKRWIGFSAKVSGQIFIDDGAKQALILKKKSLLPKGIIKTRGAFAIGSTVGILDAKNREFARGLTNYSSEELAKIKGLKSDRIEPTLGYKYCDEVVHRDNLVIL